MKLYGDTSPNSEDVSPDFVFRKNRGVSHATSVCVILGSSEDASLKFGGYFQIFIWCFSTS